MYNGQNKLNAENDDLWSPTMEKSWSGTTLDHQFWTPYMWSMSLDRCSPAFSVNDKNFQKVTNWSALVPGISSEQHGLWQPRYDIRLMTSHFFQKCQFCMLAMYNGQYNAENDSPTMEKSWSGTTRTINFGPHICDLCLWIDALLHSLWMTKIFRKSQIEALWCPESVQSSEFVTVSFIGSSLNAMELVVRFVLVWMQWN